MDKIVERLLAMAGEGATADDVTRLLASDGTALLRDLMQGYVDRCIGAGQKWIHSRR